MSESDLSRALLGLTGDGVIDHGESSKRYWTS